jgi:hypothetical protein
VAGDGVTVGESTYDEMTELFDYPRKHGAPRSCVVSGAPG